MDNSVINIIIGKYNKQLYANKSEDLEKTDIFLDAYNLQKLNHKILKTLTKMGNQ